MPWIVVFGGFQSANVVFGGMKTTTLRFSRCKRLFACSISGSCICKILEEFWLFLKNHLVLDFGGADIDKEEDC